MANVNPVPGQAAAVKDNPKVPVKAIVGALITFVSLLWANLDGKQDNLGAVTANEWIGVVVATVIAFGGIYGFSNPKVPA
jgi:hypothetical protein